MKEWKPSKMLKVKLDCLDHIWIWIDLEDLVWESVYQLKYLNKKLLF